MPYELEKISFTELNAESFLSAAAVMLLDVSISIWSAELNVKYASLTGCDVGGMKVMKTVLLNGLVPGLTVSVSL